MSVSIPPSYHQFAPAEAQAKVLLTPDQIQAVVQRLALELQRDYQDKHPVLLAVMSGALVFTGQLMTHLRFPLQLDYCHVTRYRGAARADELQWLVSPRLSLRDRHVLVLDDILDEGHTLLHIEQFVRAQGARSCASVVFCDKRHERKAQANMRAAYTGVDIPDQFVFGFGLDYLEYGRNCPALMVVESL